MSTAPSGGGGGPTKDGGSPASPNKPARRNTIGVTFYKRTNMWQVQRRLDGVLQHFGAYSDLKEACVQHDISLIKKKGWARARAMSINMDLGVHRDPRVLALEGYEPTPEASEEGGDDGGYGVSLGLSTGAGGGGRFSSPAAGGPGPYLSLYASENHLSGTDLAAQEQAQQPLGRGKRKGRGTLLPQIMAAERTGWNVEGAGGPGGHSNNLGGSESGAPPSAPPKKRAKNAGGQAKAGAPSSAKGSAAKQFKQVGASRFQAQAQAQIRPSPQVQQPGTMLYGGPGTNANSLVDPFQGLGGFPHAMMGHGSGLLLPQSSGPFGGLLSTGFIPHPPRSGGLGLGLGRPSPQAPADLGLGGVMALHGREHLAPGEEEEVSTPSSPPKGVLSANPSLLGGLRVMPMDGGAEAQTPWGDIEVELAAVLAGQLSQPVTRRASPAASGERPDLGLGPTSGQQQVVNGPRAPGQGATGPSGTGLRHASSFSLLGQFNSAPFLFHPQPVQVVAEDAVVNVQAAQGPQGQGQGDKRRRKSSHDPSLWQFLAPPEPPAGIPTGSLARLPSTFFVQPTRTHGEGSPGDRAEGREPSPVVGTSPGPGPRGTTLPEAVQAPPARLARNSSGGLSLGGGEPGVSTGGALPSTRPADRPSSFAPYPAGPEGATITPSSGASPFSNALSGGPGQGPFAAPNAGFSLHLNRVNPLLGYFPQSMGVGSGRAAGPGGESDSAGQQQQWQQESDAQAAQAQQVMFLNLLALHHQAQTSHGQQR